MDPTSNLTEEEQLMRQMRRCGHLLYHRFNLNFSQKRILLLCMDGPLTQKALACETQLQPGSLSELLTKMEAAGLIERRRSSDDKRNCEICITPSGEENARVFLMERQRMAQRLMQPLNEPDRKALSRILDTLLDHWHQLSEGEEN